MSASKQSLFVVDMQRNQDYWERLLFTSLQGIVNRESPKFYIVFKETDLLWLEWYQDYYGIELERLDHPYELFKHGWPIEGYALVDLEATDTGNLAANYAAIEDLLPVTEELMLQESLPNLNVKRDLRNRFRGKSKFELYTWALEHQWPHANHKVVANLMVPPATGLATDNSIRDYVIASRGFFFDLSSDGEKHPEEHRLKSSLYETMEPLGYVMGWHTDRDAEGMHVKQASEHGLLTLCSTRTANYSFHQHIEPIADFHQPQKPRKDQVALDPSKIYVSFIVSDGDSLNFLDTFYAGAGNAAKKNWLMEERGEFPVGWEMQPLLLDLAPGILEYYYQTATEKDTFMLSASGIGYSYPEQMPEDKRRELLAATRPYLEELSLSSLFLLQHAGPVVPREVRQDYADLLGDHIHGVVEGYFQKDAAQDQVDGMPWLLTGLPPFQPRYLSWSQGLTTSLKKIASAKEADRPMFVPVHVVNGRTNLKDVKEVIDHLDTQLFKIVSPDVLLMAYQKASQEGLIAVGTVNFKEMTRPPSYQALRYTNTVPEDGQLHDNWENTDTISFTGEDAATLMLGSTWNEVSFHAEAKAAWDDQHVYFLIEVTDNERILDGIGGDAVSIYLYDEASGIDYKLSAAVSGEANPSPIVASRGKSPGVSQEALKAERLVGRMNAASYVIEMAIPWEELATGYEPIAGKQMKFSVMVSDEEQETLGHTLWAGNGLQPESMADLIFSETVLSDKSMMTATDDGDGSHMKILERWKRMMVSTLSIFLTALLTIITFLFKKKKEASPTEEN